MRGVRSDLGQEADHRRGVKVPSHRVGPAPASWLPLKTHVLCEDAENKRLLYSVLNETSTSPALRPKEHGA